MRRRSAHGNTEHRGYHDDVRAPASGSFLITTALEETWSANQPVLWLGEWCRRYSREAHWSHFNGEVLPYHWDDRVKMHADYEQLQLLYERMLPILAAQLNETHGTDHRCRYWRILIGPWLGYFIQILFDRWSCIQQAVQQHRITETVVLVGRDEELVPTGMTDFVRLFVGDSWNHYLYGAILQEFTEVPCVRQQHASTTLPRAKASDWMQQVEHATIRTYAWVAGLLSKDSDAFFLSTYLPRDVERRLCWRLRQLPLRWPSTALSETKPDEKWRRWKLAGRSRSEFETCLRAVIPKQIPTAYLEGYGQLVDQTARLQWPQRPKLIWTSNAHSSDDVFKAWAALKVERGSPLVIGQHGGGYGTWRWSFVEDHEIAISDRYMTWGWSDPREPKITPVGNFSASTALRFDPQQNERALMISSAPPRYSYFMYSMPVARQWLDYAQEQVAFVECLPTAIRDVLTIRLYPHDFGWDQAQRWGDRFPDLRLDDGRRPIDDLIRESRLCISTSNSTSYLETFSKDVPTILFWDPNYWELRPSAIPYFDDLRRAGIFHETPESAAEHVSAIWDDVDAWWTGSRTREARERFMARYSGPAVKVLDRLERALREVTADPREAGPDT